MSKRKYLPSVILAVSVMIMFSVVAFSNEWIVDDYNQTPMNPQEFAPGDSGLSEDSINYRLFEENGPVLMILALLMFGAIIGGVYIAKEDEDNDSD